MSEFKHIADGETVVAIRDRRESPPEESRFVAEAKRLLAARLSAKTAAEREDARWAMEFLFQMHRTKRLDEYFALREAQRA